MISSQKTVIGAKYDMQALPIGKWPPFFWIKFSLRFWKPHRAKLISWLLLDVILGVLKLNYILLLLKNKGTARLLLGFRLRKFSNLWKISLRSQAKCSVFASSIFHKFSERHLGEIFTDPFEIPVAFYLPKYKVSGFPSEPL